ncbi:MAG: DNA repair protein RadC [Chitinispirillaceae bacterium]|nr:DNA repair protein RadC [Chitinispirillaceae bacterium]
MESASDAGTERAGHHLRLRERYLKNGIDALHPHEIIELLLTYTNHRKDTKGIARRLIDRFKTVNAVCNAPVEELRTISGIGEKSAALLVLVRDLLAYCLKEQYERSPVIAHRSDVESYLRISFGYRSDEYVTALFLDTSSHIVQTEIVAEGTINQCVIFPRTIIEKALRCRAASMIIAHNHPGGTAAPSEQDWQLTERIFAAGRLLDIQLIDHILICAETTVSLRDLPRWPGAGG